MSTPLVSPPTPWGHFRSRAVAPVTVTLSAALALGCERQPAELPLPEGPYYVVSASRGEAGDQLAWRHLGWLQARSTRESLSIQRALRLSPQRPLALTHHELTRRKSNLERLSWRFVVGEQRSSGAVTIQCAQPFNGPCAVKFTAEGGAREEVVQGAAPLISELWPWQLAEQGCPAPSPPLVRALIRPLSGQITHQGLNLTCLPLSEAPKALSPVWGARYQSAGEQGEVWWTAEGLGSWEAQTGTLSWSVAPPNALRPLVSPTSDLALERLALVPIQASGALPQAPAWRAIKWARVQVSSTRSGATRLLESPRQLLDPAPSAWALSKRGPSLSALKASEDQAQAPPEALARTPAYPTQSPKILRLVNEVTSSDMSPLERAQALWSWVHLEVKEQEKAGLPRVLETLESRAGDCNEQSALLTTLYRAAGLPAEQVFGLVALGAQAGYHAWVRVWLGGRWVELDPARGLDYVTAGHWALSAGDERAQEALRPLLMSAQVELIGWSKGAR